MLMFRRRKPPIPSAAPNPREPATPTRRLDAPAEQPDLQRDPKRATRKLERLVMRAAASNQDTAADALVQNLTVGWLAIVNGPGRGHTLALHAGINVVGRGQRTQVHLNYGDATISENGHLVIHYDSNRRCFYGFRGHDKAIVIVDGVALTAPRELRGGEFLTLGHTRLRFVPLCDKAFDWYEA